MKLKHPLRYYLNNVMVKVARWLDAVEFVIGEVREHG